MNYNLREVWETLADDVLFLSREEWCRAEEEGTVPPDRLVFVLDEDTDVDAGAGAGADTSAEEMRDILRRRFAEVYGKDIAEELKTRRESE